MILVKVLGIKKLIQDSPAIWEPVDCRFNMIEIPLPGEVLILNGGIPYVVTERVWFLNDRDDAGTWVPGYTEAVHVHVEEYHRDQKKSPEKA